MSIFGKIVGGLAGFAIGGPIGALIGVVAGHGFDTSRASAKRSRKQLGVEDARTVFAVGVIALGAKLAKADGVVERQEVRVIRSLFPESAADNPEIARIYNEAKNSSEGFEEYARQIALVFARQPNVLVQVLDILWAVALADGSLHPAEERFLREVARIFGLPDLVVRMVRARYESESASGREKDTEEQDLSILGLTPGASNEEIRKKYRKLVRENHPDRLVAQGMAEEYVARASDRLAAINATYDRLEKRRGL